MRVPCANGIFLLPDSTFERLAANSRSGLVFIREDEDGVTISPEPLSDGRRRQLKKKCKALSLREATEVELIDMGDDVRIMPVEWRPKRPLIKSSSH